MLGSSEIQEEENIIVKKIEGPSVDDEYDFEPIDSYYEEHEPQKSSKIKVILPLLALLVGGGAFYLIENSNTHNGKNIPTATMKSREISKEIVEKEVIKEEKKEMLVTLKKSEPDVKEEPKRYIEALAMPTVVEKELKKKESKGIEGTKLEKIKETILQSFKDSNREKEIVVQKTKNQSTLKREVVVQKNQKSKEKIVAKKVKEPTVEVQSKKVEKILAKLQSNKLSTQNITQVKSKEKKATQVKSIVKKVKPTLVAHYEKIKPRIIRVKKGDTLALLAKRFYGSEREYKRIVRANRRLKSGKTALRLGEKLVIPRKDNKRSRRYIIVQKGNTLAMIAKRFYGDEKAIHRIVKANYKIKSSHSLLHVGQKVYVPR